MTVGYEERVRALLSHVLESRATFNDEGTDIEVTFPDKSSYVGFVRLLNRRDRPLKDRDLRLFLNDDGSAFAEFGEMDPEVVIGGKPEPEDLDDDNVRIWNRVWRKFATRFGCSHAHVNTVSDEAELTLRPPHVYPHLLAIPLIVTTDDWMISVRDRPSHLHSLTTVLRFAHYNINMHSQEPNWLMAGIAECFQQLSSRACFPIYRTDLFWVDDTLWISVDPLSALLAMFKRISPAPDSCGKSRLSDAQELWRQRKLSNLDYLLLLNEFAGRKRGDPHNHPVVPWVVDFSSEDAGWRPLNHTKFRLNKGDDQLKEMFKRDPAHHVPEQLSDIGYMAYRARVESRERLCKHVRSKWEPREYPLSLRRMYQWTPEECVPELFEDPTLIVSTHFDMPDIEMPHFIASPASFITWHRAKLESEEVSAHLHEWIDLTFGYQLSGEAAVQALNVPLSSVRRRGQPEVGGASNADWFMTHGTVQLFAQPHPKRLPPEGKASSAKNVLGLNPLYEGLLRGEGITLTQIEKDPSPARECSPDDDSLVALYKRMLVKHKNRSATRDRSLQSLIVTVIEISLPAHCTDLHPALAAYSWRVARAGRLLRQHASALPRQLRRALVRLFRAATPDADSDVITNSFDDEPTVLPKKRDVMTLPTPKDAHFCLVHMLSIPVEVLSTHDRMAIYYAYKALRKHALAGSDDRRMQPTLHAEIESMRRVLMLSSRRRFHPIHPILVHFVLTCLADPTAAMFAVNRLFPVACRIFASDSLAALLPPLKQLLLNETTVKLVDRRFLTQLSIAYGARRFLDECVPTLVEAVAAKNLDRSIVAKESIMWLTRRYGPVCCARFISANLLRILASCYESLTLPRTFWTVEQQDIFRLTLDGDLTGARVETALSEIALNFSTTFITMQYLPFAVDVIEGASRRLTAQLEPALIAALRILRICCRAMNDAQLMNYLEDFISERILHRLAMLVCADQTSFSTPDARTLVTARTLSALLEVALRVGPDNSRMYMRRPMERMVETLTALYEAGDDLELQPAKGASPVLLAAFPLSFVRSAISRFSAEWGVPLLSSFVSMPACIVPYLTPTASSSSAVPAPPVSSSLLSSSFQRNQMLMTSSSTGNRLFSLSGSALSPPLAPVSTVGGASSVESSGSLSALWCARVSAAVCGMGTKSPPRLDHLSLCSFTGHSSTITSLAVVSNENSFVSASSDKTVRLWTVNADRDTTTCQYTYKSHSKAVHDVVLLATNAIASTDGVIQIWDPFRGCGLLTLDWCDVSTSSTTTMTSSSSSSSSSSGSIHRLANLDRHCLLAASSLHGYVKLLDLRAGGWVADLHCVPGAGLARAVAADADTTRLAVALSSGALAMIDARTGRVANVAHGNGTHPTSLRFINSPSLASASSASTSSSMTASTRSCVALCDADEPTAIFATVPRLNLARKLSEAALATAVDDDRELMLTAHASNHVRVYSGGELALETRLKSDVLSGQISAAARFPLNDAWLFGTSNGTIRLMC